MEEVKKKRVLFVDGLKGFACLCVLIGHYYLCFKSFTPDFKLNYYLNLFVKYPMRLFLTGGFMVYLFCLLSGFLFNKVNITTLKDLILKLIKRYLRFSLPIFFVGLFILLFGLIFGFKAHAIGILFNHPWMAKRYTMNLLEFHNFIKEFLFVPFYNLYAYNDTSINGPMWVLPRLINGSIYVMICNYLCNKFPKLDKFIILYFLIRAFSVDNFYITFITFVGAYISRFRIHFNINKYINIALAIIIYLLVCGFHSFIYELIIKNIFPIKIASFFNYYLYPCIWNAIYAILLFIVILNEKTIQNLFSSTFICKMGRWSFAIYLLHWPIICTFTSFFYLYMFKYMSYSKIYLIMLPITIIITLLMSKFFCAYIEPICIKITDDILLRIKKILNYFIKFEF